MLADKKASRREFIKSSIGAVGAVSAEGKAGWSVSKSGGRSNPSPGLHVENVIMIITDTMRRDALSVYGTNWIHTPHLDHFAQQAVIFENSFVSSFPTVLLRNDLLTGRYTFTYKPWSPIDFDAVTLPGVLSKAGILSSLVADTPHPFTPGYNYQRDFDVWRVFRGQETDQYRSAPQKVKFPCNPSKLRESDRVVTQYLRNVAHRTREEDYFVAQTMTAAADWLEENHDGRRFFLYVDTFDPHEPWDPPHYYVDRYDPGYEGEEVIYPRYDFWREFLTERELKHCRALYAGEVTMVDRWIGFLLDRIASLDLLTNTAVIVLGDHGFYLGEHGYIGKEFLRDTWYQNLPLYPEVARIPLLIYFPACKGGSRVEGLVQPVDLMPTVLDLLGVEKPPSIESVSLLPLLDGGAAKVKDFTVSSPNLYYQNKSAPPNMLFEGPDPSARSSITDGEWLLVYGAQVERGGASLSAAVDSKIRQLKEQQGTSYPELYHLVNDLGCERNVIGQNHGIAGNLHHVYLEFLRRRKIPEEQLRFYERL